ncbi:type II secretion system protein D precursor [mine drainage metagenome]|uniref:Type II secretion system protein D n=1 Tax=mine drainage metagenome TaxID=410659 RepID=A0A1J5SCB9_9ZZZZ
MPAMTTRRVSVACLAAWAVSPCGHAQVQPPSPGHLGVEGTPPGGRRKVQEPPHPAVSRDTSSVAKALTYSIVVKDVRTRDLLFSLARDARLNIDIYPGITGTISLNAIDQTLEQILKRISRQADIRWELEGTTLSVMPDTPYLTTYRVDYVNISRDTSGTTMVTTQIASAGIPGGASPSGGAGGNNSQTRVDNSARNHFWETLERNLKDILHETDKILPEGSSETVIERNDRQASTGTGAAAPAAGKRGRAQPGIAASPNPITLQQAGTTLVRRTTFREAASVISNPESGVLTVRATAHQHEKIREFLDQVMARAQRQVLIEATIAEVQLSDNYQQGIDWSALPLGNVGFRLIQGATGAIAAPPSSIFEIGYSNPASRVGNISSSVRLLESFGTVKVLSSPKLSVINNQTAVLKVVDNSVYFSIKADVTPGVSGTQPLVAYTTTLNTVPVGFVMNVTPQISEDDAVLLNIRPSVSRIIGTIADPNPDLARANVTNLIPVIRVREMETMIRVENGNIAVMGGLMEDSLNNSDNAVPGLSRLPILGAFFQNRDDTRKKTELVVFLRPIVVHGAEVTGATPGAAGLLPDRDFFASKPR